VLFFFVAISFKTQINNNTRVEVCFSAVDTT
jgi:hypothetical protein